MKLEKLPWLLTVCKVPSNVLVTLVEPATVIVIVAGVTLSSPSTAVMA